MRDFKEITKETDLTGLETSKYDWDFVHQGKPYQIVKIDGYYHSFSSKMGQETACDLYAYPLGKEMSYKNLIPFCAKAPNWGIEFSETNHLRSKWDETSFESSGCGWITRNGKRVYEIPGRDLDYALPKALTLLVDLQEHPLSLHSRDWDKKAIGRKVYFRGQPGVITSLILEQGAVIIEADGHEGFVDPPYLHSDDMPEQTVKDSLLSNLIWWFRD